MSHRWTQINTVFLDKITGFFRPVGCTSAGLFSPDVSGCEGPACVHRRLCRPANKYARGVQVRGWPKVVDGRLSLVARQLNPARLERRRKVYKYMRIYLYNTLTCGGETMLRAGEKDCCKNWVPDNGPPTTTPA